MKNLLFILIVTVSITGCDSPVVGSFKDLFAIREKVQKITESENVAVNINNGAYLSVTVVNSPLNDKTSEERKSVSNKVARIAYNHYKNRKSLKKIYVAYSAHERKYLIVDYTYSVDWFEYSSDVFAENNNEKDDDTAGKMEKSESVSAATPNNVLTQ